MRRSLRLAERDLLNRPEEEEVDEDARRRRCIRVGSTSGMFAATANSERTSTVDTIPDKGSGAFPSFGEFGLSSVTNSLCALVANSFSIA